MFGDFVGPWRRWFAWRPVTLYDGRRVWLMPLDRRRVQLHGQLSHGEHEGYWVYKLRSRRGER